jgi:hypothetical protein
MALINNLITLAKRWRNDVFVITSYRKQLLYVSYDFQKGHPN